MASRMGKKKVRARGGEEVEGKVKAEVKVEVKVKVEAKERHWA